MPAENISEGEETARRQVEVAQKLPLRSGEVTTTSRSEQSAGKTRKRDRNGSDRQKMEKGTTYDKNVKKNTVNSAIRNNWGFPLNSFGFFSFV